ncbi:MAG: hypothetical protein QME07_07865, partial [bacterium]|nr:hypothetical protein [bacterium]
MFKEKTMRGLICLVAIMLASRGWALGEKEKGTPAVEKVGTVTTTEIEALGPTKAVSSIMSGLGRKGT